MVKIAVCDDDISYQEIISYKIKECLHKNFRINCEIVLFSDLNSFVKSFNSSIFDIVFMDIMLDTKNAMDWSVNNIKNHYSQIIFMTSYPECAYSISETDCCYYLIKSKINDENLTKALKTALQNNTKKNPNLIQIKTGSKNHTINSQDILFTESFSNNITIHMINGDCITAYLSLKEIIALLPHNFLRCHKSYLINMNHIKSYEPHKFNLTNDISVPVPPKKYKDITAEYQNYLYTL